MITLFISDWDKYDSPFEGMEYHVHVKKEGEETIYMHSRQDLRPILDKLYPGEPVVVKERGPGLMEYIES